MVRSEVVARIAVQNPHLYARDVERVVAAILDRMATALADGDRVELRDFGAFAVRDREARTGRNPRSGQSVTVTAKRSVHFKPGKAMRARLNLKLADWDGEAERLLQAS
ncbi:integration host factor subunit beta [Methylobacterium sp. J-030]|uniref:integration host factor subunit beta n=1 Tax=Methylobacterium sp. J-030 TaxID=2836627 RepID=UPI001FBA22DD|nr:integration host factor subunit beta [Methylobacterium sp. J-030]MCJ2067967.1 integration host factor subunit beta [Methylobacterium sp. J-030]